MSQTQFSTSEVKVWLEKETDSTFKPVQAHAQKHRDNIQAALQNLSDASKMLLDLSQKEIDKKNMKVFNRARALNKLAALFIERIKKLPVPEQVSYDNLSSFAQETQKALTVTEVDIKNWFPRISPFFIMDRRKFMSVYEKTKATFNDLTSFLTKEYVKTKTIEETFQAITELQDLEAQLAQVNAQKTDLKNERIQIEKEITAIEQQINNLKHKTTIQQLDAAEAQTENLSNELKHEIRHLQKAFIKMQALSISGGGAGLTPDETKALGLYLENPFEAIITEPSGCPTLKDILQKLSRLMNEDKLKLKPDKARKAEQAIEDVLKRDSLASLHRKCVETATQRKKLANSEEMEKATQDIATFEEQLEQLKIRRNNLGADEHVKENAYNELLAKINNSKKKIEINIQSFLGVQVHIQ